MPGFEIINDKEYLAVKKLFKKDGGVLFAHGFDKIRKKYHVREFEENFKKKINCEHALAVSSGTAAIKIALKALGVKKGDEVITQAFNFIATVEAILDIGAKPVIINVNKTLNMDPKKIESVITKKTKVILPVHMLGVPAEMDLIIKIAKKYRIKVLEDNCESLGAKYKNKYLIGDVGVASLDYGKVITCGEGGLIYTNNKKIDKYAREYHDHGHENNPTKPRGKDTRTIFGFNYRLTEKQEAICKEQLKKLDFIIRNNKKRYDILNNELSSIVDTRSIPVKADIIYDTFIFFVKNKKLKSDIVNLLNKEGIGTKNLPDAIEWHCASFWDHALTKNQIKKVLETKYLLEESIAIPIWLKKSIFDYKKISKKIVKLIK